MSEKINELININKLLLSRVEGKHVIAPADSIVAGPNNKANIIPINFDNPNLPWGDKSSELDDSGFTVVQRQVKHPRTPTEVSKLPTLPKVIKGKCSKDNEHIQANKKLIKKAVYHVGNLKKCSKQRIIDFLLKHNVNTLGCFPLFKKSADVLNPPKPTEDSESTSFKIIINVDVEEKFCDPEIWPEGTLISRWVFSDRPQQNSLRSTVENRTVIGDISTLPSKLNESDDSVDNVINTNKPNNG
ncbi:hypothetical protein HELRODRAFT_162114 [Helobdella robusta]|uniref:Uncharacterized protein n=1 Tax=Helobdella robusta TaxID=6412 RepID=T1ES90_HELRO|nr:hypothetical protein HELRODRAFT_162114 [Helobdella robusta]ESN98664.1 hypothetical protein HELRODRAFT_162114 [Helobdella robusta]